MLGGDYVGEIMMIEIEIEIGEKVRRLGVMTREWWLYCTSA